MAPHSSTLAWKIPWTEEPGRLQSMGLQKSDTTERLHFHFSLSCTGEGNGNPLQCSYLENPRDGGAWWAAVYGGAQSWTQLKRLSSSSRYTFTYSSSNMNTVLHTKCNLPPRPRGVGGAGDRRQALERTEGSSCQGFPARKFQPEVSET